MRLVVRIAVVVACLGAVAVAIYAWVRRDPTPIKLDPRIYDAYAGHYNFQNNYIVTVRRDGDRLMSIVPERLPQEFFPVSPTTFFVKAQPGRISFHRGTNGQVDYMVFRWKKFEDTGQRVATLPPVLECTNAMIAATTGGKAVEGALI